VGEPGSAQDRKPQPETPAVATLLPATSAPLGAPAPAPAPGPAPAAAPAAVQGGGGFWSRFRKLLAGEPAPVAAEPAPLASAPAPARSTRREEGRYDSRRERPRHSRSGGEGARRDRGDGRRSEGRDRNRDHRGGGGDRSRDRDGGRRPERSGERSGAPPREPREPVREAAAVREDVAPLEGAAAPPGGGGTPGEAPRAERSGRGRRGRRRGRRGGGGGGTREQVAGGAPAEAGLPGRESVPEVSGPGEVAGNGHNAQEPLPRQYHAEPREAVHELAHFEPAPRPEGAGAEHKPYVVWSSAPAEKLPGSHGPEVPEE